MSHPTPPGYGAPGAPTHPGSMPPASPYGAPQGPYGAPAYKPGTIPLQPLGLGEILEGAFASIRHNWKVMLGLSSLVIVLVTVIGVAIGAAFLPLIDPWWTRLQENPEFATYFAEANLELSATWLAITAGAGIALPLAAPVVTGILTVSVSRSAIGDRITPRQVWARIRPRIWPLIAWLLLQVVITMAAVAIFVGLVVAIVGGVGGGLAVVLVILLSLGFAGLAIWISIKVMLVPAALALEGQAIWKTVSRVWELTRGGWWRILGISLLAGIIASLASSLISTPFTLIGLLAGATAGGGALGVATLLGQTVVTILTTAFVSAVTALLYIDLRIRKENLAPTLAASAMALAGR
ncbi:MAG: hypothetical protein FWG11_03115 [Promicromonosporaceae bacterium]|nr:hypothetical protein [Promicromonosporaceae bacterium]